MIKIVTKTAFEILKNEIFFNDINIRCLISIFT